MTASTGATNVSLFQVLKQEATLSLEEVRAVYPREQFPDASEALGLLRNCIRLFEQEKELTQRSVTALRNCQSSARVLAESLSSPLGIPEAPQPAQALPPLP